MYREAARWLEAHELNQNGQWFVDEAGESLGGHDKHRAVAACIAGSCMVVAARGPIGLDGFGFAIRNKVAELYPVEFEAAGESYVTWNDSYATKEQVLTVLNAIADDLGEAA